MSKLWFSPMITITCLIGVVVCGGWLACAVLAAAAAVIVAVTATTAPATTAGWMSFLAMRLTPSVCGTGRAVPCAAWLGGSARHTHPSVTSQKIAR